jgi:hypothetical protein
VLLGTYAARGARVMYAMRHESRANPSPAWRRNLKEEKMRRTTMLVVCTLALALFAGYASAATTTPPADTLKVDYFSNANNGGASDGTVRITNPGTSGGNLCAAIFVYDSSQELSECCSCLVTPNGLRTLSVDTDLTSNPLTGKTLNTGSIRIVPSKVPASGVCPVPTYVSPTASLRAWATHIQNGPGFAVTETASQDATFSAAEQTILQSECYAISLDGSGTGICSCGTGD